MSAQSMQALARANQIRMDQAAFKRTLRAAGYADAPKLAAEALRDPSEIVGGIRLDCFLAAIPYYGAARIGRLTSRCGMAASRLKVRIRDLHDREREIVAAALTERYATRSPISVSDRAADKLDRHWHTTGWIATVIGVSPNGTGQALARLESEGRAERFVDGDTCWWRTPQ